MSTTQQPSPPPLARPQGPPTPHPGHHRRWWTDRHRHRRAARADRRLRPDDRRSGRAPHDRPHRRRRRGRPRALTAALAGSDIVVNALPFHLTTTCLDAALAVGADYVDLTEDVAASREVRAKAAASGVTVVPQCGLAPGFVSVAANGLAERFDRVRDLSLRVGALPRSPSNALGYNLTWSTEGVVNEYIEPCQAIVGGRLVEVPPLESLETIGVDGVRYEAFNTSGGLGTLCETWLGRCERLDYKSVRHPGHAGIMKVLLHDLRLADHRDELHALLERALPTTDDDMVVISVSVTGWRDGRLTEDTFARTIHGPAHRRAGPQRHPGDHGRERLHGRRPHRRRAAPARRRRPPGGDPLGHVPRQPLRPGVRHRHAASPRWRRCHDPRDRSLHRPAVAGRRRHPRAAGPRRRPPGRAGASSSPGPRSTGPRSPTSPPRPPPRSTTPSPAPPPRSSPGAGCPVPVGASWCDGSATRSVATRTTSASS